MMTSDSGLMLRTKEAVTEEQACSIGITMTDFINVAELGAFKFDIPAKVEPVYALTSTQQQEGSDEMGDEIKKKETKALLLTALAEGPRSAVRVAANYHMTTAGQPPFGGHFAPLVAYHHDSDSFLLMDPWPKTEPLWVTWDTLWPALQKVDPESGMSRGLLFVTFGPEPEAERETCDYTSATGAMLGVGRDDSTSDNDKPTGDGSASSSSGSVQPDDQEREEDTHNIDTTYFASLPKFAKAFRRPKPISSSEALSLLLCTH